MSDTSFLAELRRRRVLPIAGAYVGIAWLVTEIASFLLMQSGAPGWTIRLLAIIFIVGFPISVVLAWTIQVGPDGKRSFDPSTGQGKTVIGAVLLGVFSTAGLAWLILPRIDDTGDSAAYLPLPDSLAVLPFMTTTGTPNERTVAETLYTVLLDGLDQSRELTQVRLRIEERPTDPVAFGREFRVAALLFGKVFRAAGTTRIELELLDVGRGEVRWSQTIDWDPTRIVEIGTRISDAVLRSMGLPEIPRKRFVGTDSREAYEAYLLGRKHFDVMNAKNVAISVEYFEQAVTLDPGYVRGHARLASAYRLNGMLGSTTRAERQEWTERSREAANKAVDLDSDSADALSGLALVTVNPELQAQLLERALELEPNHGPSLHRYAGLVLRPAGRIEEAAALYQRLLDIHPLDANNRYELGVTLMEMGAREDAVAQLERSIELQPDMMQNYHTLGYWMVFEYGRLDEALLLHRKSFAVNPETGHEAAPVAQSYAALGMREEALTFLEKALELLDWTPDVMFMAAHTHARLGDSDIAREHYERFVEAWGDRPHFSIPKIIVDIGLVTGQHEDALQRFRTRFPGSVNEDVIIDDDNFYGVFAYARLLQAAGYSDEARRRFERVAVFVESVCADDQDNLDCRYLPWQVYAHLGDRRKTLDWLRFAIVDKRYFANNHFFDTEALDFLRDDPEFRDLMGYVDAEMNKQRTRIREMECAGEIPRAPGIDTAAFCA